MSLRLLSNFHDFYDHAFPREGDPFVRNSVGGPSRIEMFNMMSGAGMEVPKHGLVSDLYKDMESNYSSPEEFQKSEYSKLVQLVVYTDIMAHCGDGKELMTLEDANTKAPNCYASQYLPHSLKEKAETYRCQVIGEEVFWMLFHSEDDWRSNCGDVDITYIERYDGLVQKMENLRMPFYAIDFVCPHASRGIGEELTAIDLNVAPGLKGTPIEKLLTPKEVVKLIEKRYYEINK